MYSMIVGSDIWVNWIDVRHNAQQNKINFLYSNKRYSLYDKIDTWFHDVKINYKLYYHTNFGIFDDNYKIPVVSPHVKYTELEIMFDCESDAHLFILKWL